MNEDIVLYDFCGTLVDFQTANAFVRFVLDKTGRNRNLAEYFRIALHKFRLLALANRLYRKMSVNKALLLYQLKGLSAEDMDRYAKEFYELKIKPHLVQPVLERLKKDVAQNRRTIIISGGYEAYIKYFAKEFNVSDIICSELKYTKGKFTGKLIGCDCMDAQKVTRLYDYFPSLKNKSPKTSLTFYSDSETDLPLFKECKERITVIADDVIPKWAQEISTEIIQIEKNSVPA